MADSEVLRGWRHPPAGTGWFQRFILRAQYVLVVSLFNVFPLPQQSGFRRSFAFAGETMDRGYSVLVFPEGARSPDGEMKPFMEGIALLVKNLNVPIVPARTPKGKDDGVPIWERRVAARPLTKLELTRSL